MTGVGHDLATWRTFIARASGRRLAAIGCEAVKLTATKGCKGIVDAFLALCINALSIATAGCGGKRIDAEGFVR